MATMRASILLLFDYRSFNSHMEDHPHLASQTLGVSIGIQIGEPWRILLCIYAQSADHLLATRRAVFCNSANVSLCMGKDEHLSLPTFLMPTCPASHSGRKCFLINNSPHTRRASTRSFGCNFSSRARWKVVCFSRNQIRKFLDERYALSDRYHLVR